MIQNEKAFEAIDYKTESPIHITVKNGYIADIQKSDKQLDPNEIIAPGLVDLQLNGYQGIDLNQEGLQSAEVIKMTQSLWKQGITTYYPTIITNDVDTICTLLSTIAESCRTNIKTNQSIGGIHLEGPFLSPQDGPRGAHPRQFIREPDWELFSRWQKCARGRIKMITIAPEWPGAIEFIKKCVGTKVVVAIGHTAATPDRVNQAVEAGASISTHLGNASHQMLPRHHNYIWEQLANESLWSTFIADGFHLPVSLLKVFLKMKARKAILISDATSFAGLSPGSYTTHIGGKVELDKQGRLFMKNHPNMLAGSAHLLPWCINHLVKENILSFQEAWDMASEAPVRFFTGQTTSAFEVGKPADFVLIRKTNKHIKIIKTIKSGEIVFCDKDGV